MESLNKLFTESEINDVSTKILKQSIDKVADHLQGAFSQELESWIYEHYTNSKGKIESDLIKEITEEFVQNPMQYKFSKLREKLFLENKESITKTLTDEAIMLSVENTIENYTHRNYHFHWKWKEAIVKIVFENWHKFQEDEIVNNRLLREISNLKLQVASLQEKINEISSIAE